MPPMIPNVNPACPRFDRIAATDREFSKTSLKMTEVTSMISRPRAAELNTVFTQNGAHQASRRGPKAERDFLLICRELDAFIRMSPPRHRLAPFQRKPTPVPSFFVTTTPVHPSPPSHTAITTNTCSPSPKKTAPALTAPQQLCSRCAPLASFP